MKVETDMLSISLDMISAFTIVPSNNDKNTMY